nr:hypothetical protein [Ferrimicrobium acidiphilum]
MSQAVGGVMGRVGKLSEDWRRLAKLDKQMSPPTSCLHDWLKKTTTDVSAPPIVIDEAALYFMKGVRTGIVSNSKKSVACALALACRNHGADKIKEIADVVGIKAMRLVDGVYNLANGIGVTVKEVNISRELVNDLQALGLTQQDYVEVSKHVAAVAKKYPSSARVRTLFAAVTYGLHSTALTQKQTAAAFGVDEYTLRSQWIDKVKPYIESMGLHAEAVR